MKRKVMAALVAAALSMGTAGPGARAQGAGGEAGVELQASAPRSFFLPKSEYDLPSWWVAEGTGAYRERYEPGAGLPDNILRVVGRGVMNGVEGTLVYRPEVAVFVPDAGTGSEWVGLYWRGEWKEKWRAITQVNGAR